MNFFACAFKRENRKRHSKRDQSTLPECLPETAILGQDTQALVFSVDSTSVTVHVFDLRVGAENVFVPDAYAENMLRIPRSVLEFTTSTLAGPTWLRSGRPHFIGCVPYVSQLL